MLKAERMSKIRIVVPKTNLQKVVEKLHALKILHIVDHKKNDELDIGEPVGDIETISALLVKIRALSKKPEKRTPYQRFSLKEIDAKVCEIEEYIKKRKGRASEINQNITNLKTLLHQLDILNSLYLDLESYQLLNSISCCVGSIKHKEDIKEEINKITTKYKLHIAQNGKTRLIALFISRNKENEVFELLKKKYSFAQINVNDVISKNLKGNAITHINNFNEKLHDLEEQKEKFEKDIEGIKLKNKKILNEYEEFLSTEAEKSEVPLRFGQTSSSVLITGWVPSKRAEKVIKELEETAKNRVYVEDAEIDKKESTPIRLKNPFIAKPFEFFMRLYTLPKYKEIDPTFFIFLTFPIFFGFMLGDVGYGLVTLLLFWWLKKIIPSGKDLLNSMMACSYWTTIFGFLFGEYFGFEYVKSNIWQNIIETLKLPLHKALMDGEIVYEFPRLINRMHGYVDVLGNNIHIVLIIGAIVGIIHINLSILLGFMNELESHGLKKAILARLSWYVFEIGLVLLALNLLNIITVPLYIAVILLIISAVMIYLGEGVQGIIEIFSLFSNTLSYLRLGAVGLASVGLAVVVNEELGMPFIEKGGLFILLAIIIMILGHAINIALGIIGPFLHAIRLHYVEFFMRFYKGGGKAYKPFGAAEEDA